MNCRLIHKHKINRIEREYQEPFEAVVKDFFSYKDYLGYSLGIWNIGQILNINQQWLRNFCREIGIKYQRLTVDYGRAEDTAWVKYGITLKHYLESRQGWMTLEEMAVELCVSRQDIQKKMRELKIKKTEVYTARWERCKIG